MKVGVAYVLGSHTIQEKCLKKKVKDTRQVYSQGIGVKSRMLIKRLIIY